jgi:hypothetical protein
MNKYERSLPLPDAQGIHPAHQLSDSLLQPLRLSDIAWLEKFFRNLVQPLADVDPTVILAWRKAACLEYLIEDGVLYIFGDVGLRRVLWLPPLGSVELSLVHIFRGLYLLCETYARTGLGIIRNLWEQYPLWSELQGNNAFLISTEATEYQYCTSAVSDLAGHKFKAKRADVRFFINNYRPLVNRYEPRVAADCLVLLDRWLMQKRERCEQAALDKAVREYEVCKAALCDRLPLEGVVCTVGSRLMAFSLGMPHGDNSFNCIFEKADLALRGCSAFVFSTLAKSLRGRFSYINAGEDWGLPELALAKQLWRPALTRKTYRLTARQNSNQAETQDSNRDSS